MVEDGAGIYVIKNDVTLASSQLEARSLKLIMGIVSVSLAEKQRHG